MANKTVHYEVEIPAGVSVSVLGEFNAHSGGKLQVDASSVDREEAKESIREFADALVAATK